MSSFSRASLLFVATLALTGCSQESSADAGTSVDAGTSLDAGTSVDAGMAVDAGTSDAGDGGGDAGTGDAGPVDAGDPDVEDAGSGSSDAGPDVEPWDGGAATLPERTDAKVPAPYSDCTFTLATNASVADCNDLSLFDRASCPADAFNTLESVGHYRMLTQSPSGFILAGYGVSLPFDGSAGTMLGWPLTRQQVGAGAFFVSSTFGAVPPALPAREFIFVGCTRTEPRRVNGCFVQCSDGKVRSKGTFTALRHSWGRGESESSGGLFLRSETRVPLGLPVEVAVAKDHAYVVAAGDRSQPGGLAVFDVTTRTSPVLVQRIPVPADTALNSVWAEGDALYIASRSGVLIYDISSPADPRYVRAVPDEPLNVHTVHVQGDRLYAMSPSPTGQTLLFDASSPFSPVLLNRATASGDLGGPHDAFAYQDRLYVSSTSSGYVVFDVADPTHVQELGAYRYNGQDAHTSAVGTFAGRTLAFEASEGPGTHLRVLDVTDPANMRLIGEYALRPEYSIHHLILRGTKLYITHYQEGVRVLDVSVPPKPREVAYFNTFLETQPGRGSSLYEGAIGIRVPGDGYVYVVDSSRGLLILREP